MRHKHISLRMLSYDTSHKTSSNEEKGLTCYQTANVRVSMYNRGTTKNPQPPTFHTDIHATLRMIRERVVYSSSSPSSSPLAAAAAARLRLTRPGRPPPYGEVRAKSMCFWESRRTTKEGTLTICLPTLKISHCKQCHDTSQDEGYSPDVSLPDQNASMVNTLSKTTLEHLSLEPPLQEIFNLQSQHIIETHAALVEHTDTD